MPIESGHNPIRGIGLIQEITGEIDLVHDSVRGIEGLIQEITDGIDLVQEIAGEIDLDLDQEIIGVDYTLQGDKIIIFFFFFLIIKNFSQKIFKNFISNNSDSLLKLNYFDFDFKFN